MPYLTSHYRAGIAAASFPMSMTRAIGVLSVLVWLVSSATVWAQAVTETAGLSLSRTLAQLTTPLGSTAAGEALSLATSLEVATTPFGTSSAGFAFKLDPATGLRVRTATTFGPSFAERALTSGEGKVSASVSLISASYQKLGDLSLESLRLGSVESSVPAVERVGTTNLTISSTTLVISGTAGVTDNLDIGVAIPMVKVKVSGFSTLVNGAGNEVLTAQGGGTSSGLGDVAAVMKYRLHSFGDTQPDPGGIALLATMRLPTGDTENLRGLGVTRTLVSLVYSSGQGRFRPHANGGFEGWSDGVDLVVSFDPARPTIETRHQIQYAAGFEYEASPKLTLLMDLLGRHILGAGQVGYQTQTPTTPIGGATSLESLVALPEGIRKLTLVPGLKLNLKGNMLLSLNVLTTLVDNGLHAPIIPVFGVDLTF
jgi:hypothetical protein